MGDDGVACVLSLFWFYESLHVCKVLFRCLSQKMENLRVFLGPIIAVRLTGRRRTQEEIFAERIKWSVANMPRGSLDHCERNQRTRTGFREIIIEKILTVQKFCNTVSVFDIYKISAWLPSFVALLWVYLPLDRF